MARRENKSSTAFLDLLFNSLLVFFIMLICTIILVNPETENEGDIPLKAEYLITMEWPDGNINDVDLFVQLPTKDIVYFMQRDIPMANLDRDDYGPGRALFGKDGNMIQSATIGEEYRDFENWEHVTIRKSMPGEYVVNVLMFKMRDLEPTPVSIKVEKLNPYQVVYSGTIELEHARQEETVVKFTVNSKGKVTSKDSFFTSLVNKVRVED